MVPKTGGYRVCKRVSHIPPSYLIFAGISSRCANAADMLMDEIKIVKKRQTFRNI
jgi:hypothetical protein